jgi:UDP-3-O-[3-hydroxymyristoyl] glucosamine N-acyltransferase
MQIIRPVALLDLIKETGDELVWGSKDFTFSGIKEPAQAGSDQICFLIQKSFLVETKTWQAGVYFANADLCDDFIANHLPNLTQPRAVFRCKDAYWSMAVATKLFVRENPWMDWLPAESGSDYQLEDGAVVCPGAVVGKGTRIGKGSVIMPGAVVGSYCDIGSDTKIFPCAVIYPRTMIGNGVRIHSNAVIGADGFGYARGPRGSEKIWHLGRVIIGNNVEIGAGSCVDRGTLGDSIVEAGAKIDNLVQIGHNGHIKAHAILCAQTGLAGNVTVGQGAILAGQAGVADKVVVGDGAVIGPQTGVSKDVEPKQVMMSAFPARQRKEWWKLLAVFDRLPEIHAAIKVLQKEKCREG